MSILTWTMLMFLISIFSAQVYQPQVSGSLGSITSSNAVPTGFIASLLTVFILAILDRFAYTFRSLRFKLVLHYVVTFLGHIIIFFYIPKLNGQPFDGSPLLVLLYLFFAGYLWYSAQQLKYGYPLYCKQHFFAEADRKGDVVAIFYKIYMMIPFIFELRIIIDWCTSTTSMPLGDWFTLEDIRAALYSRDLDIQKEKRHPRPEGQRLPQGSKCLKGVIILFFIVLVIWLPLLLFSSGSPQVKPNPVDRMTMSVSFFGYSPVYVNNAVVGKIGVNNFNDYQRENSLIYSPMRKRYTQVASLPEFSQDNWAISPPGKESLVAALLEGSETVSIVTDVVIMRGDGSNFDYRYERVLTTPEKAIVVDLLVSTSSIFVEIPRCFPRYIAIPFVGSATEVVSDDDVDLIGYRLSVEYADDGKNNTSNSSSGTGMSEWWSVVQIPTTLFADNATTTTVLLGSPRPYGILAAIASAGIVGLYAGVVWAVGSAIRGSVTGIHMSIPYEEMDDVRILLSMVDDIYVARKNGNTLLESEIYNDLLQIYRSTESLIAMSKPVDDEDESGGSNGKVKTA